ncbi:MAG: phosphopentomutase [Eubacteriales bacterium]|nr:phosphopentomutase [Eubacteriales bacterium]
MKKNGRVFLIILDSVGAGELPDAASYGDEGSNTILSISKSPYFNCPNLTKAGLFNIPSLKCGREVVTPSAAYGNAAECSAGKDTVVGHWEIAGIITDKPFPVYPAGFPKEVVEEFENTIGTKTLCNKPYSGTEVIGDYGELHLKTKYPIIYTSADSVFQIACHESVYSIGEQYEMCLKARTILQGEHGVSRVIARPFAGEPGAFYRTANRKDFSLEPAGDTMLDIIYRAGYDVISVGKIKNIFSGRGITKSYHTSSNAEGIGYIKQLQHEDFCGLCFVNLVDFDMIYGHRNDIDGYARALSEFDAALGEITENQQENDLYIITADHGCDPATPSTDHSREYIPILCFGNGIKPVPIGTRDTFADIGCTVCGFLGTDYPENGKSFLEKIL